MIDMHSLLRDSTGAGASGNAGMICFHTSSHTAMVALPCALHLLFPLLLCPMQCSRISTAHKASGRLASPAAAQLAVPCARNAARRNASSCVVGLETPLSCSAIPSGISASRWVASMNASGGHPSRDHRSMMWHSDGSSLSTHQSRKPFLYAKLGGIEPLRGLFLSALPVGRVPRHYRCAGGLLLAASPAQGPRL